MADEKGMSDSKKELQPPDWLDAAFVQEALHRGGEKNVQVKSVTVRAATAPGDNYASSIFRTKATLTDGSERSLIVKLAPPGEEMINFIHESGFFQNEITMFGSIVPQMEGLLNAAAPGRYPPLSARGLHHGNDPVFLVLEDLAPQGFKMADRHKGLGLRHALIALRALARFHAASAAVLERNPSVANGFQNPFKHNAKSFEIFTVGSMEATANACRTWPGFEDHALCLDAFKPLIMEKFGELHDPKPGGFNVLLHGDFWMNNMLFRYEDGKPCDVRLLDLQLSHLGPAVTDILYFLSSSLSESVSTHCQDLLLREYHTVLVESMELLGLQPPSLGALLDDISSHGAYSLFGALTVLPFVKATDIPDINAVLGGDYTAATTLYEDPVVKRWFQRIIPEYRRKGWLPG